MCSSDLVASATVGLVRDHEILRTTYQQPAGMRLALQHVHDELAASVRVFDGSADDAARAELLTLAQHSPA